LSKVPILQLVQERVVVMDGAMGSLLMSKGLPPGIPLENWNVTHVDVVKNIHLDYFNAGSDIVLTNTFGGSRLKLTAHKHGDKVEEYNQQAAEIAKEVCPEQGYVAGDIGPSGKFLPPLGDATTQMFFDNFEEQASILAKAGIDLFFVETMVDILEAEAAVKAIRKVCDLPIFASITYQKTKRGYFTVMGNTVEQCSNILEKAGASIIGANCTIGSDEMIELVPLLKGSTTKPVLVKPNAGMPQLIKGETVYPTTPQDFAEDIKQMVDYGAQIVGGCCGTEPTFIKNITRKLQE
jgi:5-methyltetrahydrofolate--homocysteine methyltransferase